MILWKQCTVKVRLSVCVKGSGLCDVEQEYIPRTCEPRNIENSIFILRNRELQSTKHSVRTMRGSQSVANVTTRTWCHMHVHTSNSRMFASWARWTRYPARCQSCWHFATTNPSSLLRYRCSAPPAHLKHTFDYPKYKFNCASHRFNRPKTWIQLHKRRCLFIQSICSEN